MTEAGILPNLKVLTGAAEYGGPGIEDWIMPDGGP